MIRQTKFLKPATIFICISFLIACNNPKSTSSTLTDSTSSANAANTEMMHTDNASGDVQATDNTAAGSTTTDSATSVFLQKAADGGLAEVVAGRMAEGKANDEGVKRFAAMMVNDHSGANQQLKDLARQRNISLPSEPSAEHKQKMHAVDQKEGKAFERAYMDMMVEDHRKTISLFRESSERSSDNPVKEFISATLPKLQMHLDSAIFIRNNLKN